ncbi:hypothetical protein FSP39_012212 [Pinctada imbricata]|uniref:BTB domain-containing protein n=1 Tax=Pinctada imbricata TaxID=66713 RepID=A0AA88Y0L8_PINIB|nr:hypothetical protein FSP39_012212 [Pinctada imbricata]
MDAVPAGLDDEWLVKYVDSLCEGLLQQYTSQQYTDATIRVDDKVFQCHRVVLSAMSPYFDAMFSSGMRETEENIVTLQGTDAVTFDKILSFIYGRKYVIDVECVSSLLQTSVMLQIKCLQEQCEEFMITKVDTENCIGTWKLANGHGCHYLAHKAYRFILHYFNDIRKTEDFAALDLDELLTIIQDNDLNVKREEDVCDAVFQWITFNNEQRTKHLPNLVENLRFPLVQPEYLIEVVERFPDILNDQICREVLEEAKRYHLLPARRQDFVSSRLVYRNYDDFEEVIICIGGSDSTKSSSRDVLCYSTKNRQWHHLCPMPYDPGVEFAVCSYGNAIFVSGGSSNMNGMMYFVSTQNKWGMREPMLLGRRRHAMVSVGDSLYVLGGYNDEEDDCQFRTLLSVERFTIGSEKWEDAGYLSIPIRSASAAVDKDKIYLFGGVTSSDCDTKVIQCFDTRQKTCSRIGELPVYCRLSTALSCMQNILIVCPTGHVLSFSEGVIKEFGKISGFERYSFGAVILSNTILILGGTDSNEPVDEFISFDMDKKSASLTGEYMPVPMFDFGCLKTVINKKHMR